MLSRRTRLTVVLLGLSTILSLPWMTAAANEKATVTRYCRFKIDDTTAYGIVEGDQVRQLEGDLFGEFTKTDKTFPLSKVTLVVPVKPSQVIAMAGNYKSHLGDEEKITTKITNVTTVTTDQKTGETSSETTTVTETRKSGEVPEKFQVPQPFFKSPSCLQRHEGKIIIPKGSEITHFEAEMVIVIGKRARNVSKEDALSYVFGVTCGNDVSARAWQKGDVQWWRAKGADTFGPCGPFITSGLDYDNLLLQLRLNGKTMQEERTSQLIHDVPTMVSFVSQYVTLKPGDLIFTGTPGTTSEIQPGDVVEVELEGVGVLRNEVRAEK
jgi:2-keto-4-pentenoate hydratase/2-oxohepta-3-ene-1,7-dioic acid hydratase in catechol pathway